jgi:hypothetical protein
MREPVALLVSYGFSSSHVHVHMLLAWFSGSRPGPGGGSGHRPESSSEWCERQISFACSLNSHTELCMFARPFICTLPSPTFL